MISPVGVGKAEGSSANTNGAPGGRSLPSFGQREADESCGDVPRVYLRLLDCYGLEASPVAASRLVSCSSRAVQR